VGDQDACGDGGGDDEDAEQPVMAHVPVVDLDAGSRVTNWSRLGWLYG